MNITSETNVSKKTTRLYILALTAIALLSLGGQLLVQKSLSDQLSDSRVINIAGRQRMLSQKICKTALLLINQKDTFASDRHTSDLQEAVALWDKCHQGLRKGYLDTLKSSFENSDTILNMFKKIEPRFSIMLSNAKIIANYFKNHNTYSSIHSINNAVYQLLSNERAYLKAMDSIVFQYQVEATQRVNKSRSTEHVLFACTLFILLLEAIFVFRPAVSQIKETIAKLIDSEKKTHLINEQLISANKSLQETREALIEANNQKHLREINKQKIRSSYLVEGQEEERKRIAREIHDGLGQMLTALKFGIEKVTNSPNLSTDDQNSLVNLQNLVADTISEVRTISFNLMPTVLSDFGISSALKLLSSQISHHTGVKVTYSTNMTSERLFKNVEIGIYRICQEAIHNAVKYSKAKEIKVDVSLKKKYIHLKISDDGKGFTYDEKKTINGIQGPGNGISNMRERAFLIDGDIKIFAQPGKGTEIHLKTPILDFEYEKD